MAPDPRLRSPETPVRKKGRGIALALAGVWVVLLVVLYIAIVRLKLGGAEALRTPSAADASENNSPGPNSLQPEKP